MTRSWLQHAELQRFGIQQRTPTKEVCRMHSALDKLQSLAPSLHHTHAIIIMIINLEGIASWSSTMKAAGSQAAGQLL